MIERWVWQAKARKMIKLDHNKDSKGIHIDNLTCRERGQVDWTIKALEINADLIWGPSQSSIDMKELFKCLRRAGDVAVVGVFGNECLALLKKLDPDR